VYSVKTSLPLHQMEEMAWVLDPRGDGKRIGFLSPQERRDRNLQPSPSPIGF
jgi:hypothetical protein